MQQKQSKNVIFAKLWDEFHSTVNDLIIQCILRSAQQVQVNKLGILIPLCILI